MGGGDRFVIGLVAVVWTAATVYIFKFHSDVNFATYAGLCITMTGFYHFMLVRDSKIPDAP